MRGKRARIIRKQARIAGLDAGYQQGAPVVYQSQADGKVKRILGAIKDVLKKRKTYVVTGQIFSPAQSHYRAMKRAWTRRHSL